ncbi:thioredoxin domain-containing protein [Risungbinella massiliensis]|uniref:thioredoxin domain-containing protein n=1 Tax=Risungbinella massiliensis TaxID=1329796 RepID=UPI0005CBE966|nr:thioredoxin domain-containing protein [Risungbinella massiliensis]
MGKEKAGKKPNRLVNEKSPYLLQHAYNPVNWYPWSDEAFSKAKAEDKPIFLSIGYSTCHWCHVMERESFEDEEVAEILNQHFVSIKVDREERPDLDNLYMTVCQALTGHGGWPLTILLTPSQKPFFAGTYFPKEDRYGRTGLVKLLTSLSKMWAEEKDKAENMGTQLISQLDTFFHPGSPGTMDRETIDYAYEQMARQYDETYGGFGEAPKFPRPHDLLFLLRYSRATGEPEAAQMVNHTLRQMRKGGIFDQIGYGFSRYSVDREWLVPHFEKMLYDQALLAIAYLEAYQNSQDPFFAKVAEEIFSYIMSQMTSPEGAFYSAEDADSEGEEGKFYVFQFEELEEVLGEELAPIFLDYYGVTPEGNFDGNASILHQIEMDLDRLADQYKMSSDTLTEKLEQARKLVLEYRNKRERPFLDDKVLTSWNAMMIAAFARGGRVLQNTNYLDCAQRAFDFLRERLCREDGRVLARFRENESAILGYLDDYAYFTWAAIELYEATTDVRALQLALQLQKETIRLFGDKEKGGYFFSGVDAEKLIARPKEIFDGAVPSGNSVVFLNLIRLAKLTSDQDLLNEAERQAAAFAEEIRSAPISHTFFLVGYLFWIYPSKEILIRGSLTDPMTKRFLREIHRHYLPEAVLGFDPGANAEANEQLFLPITEEVLSNQPAVYLCEDFACQRPITQLEDLQKALSATK